MLKKLTLAVTAFVMAAMLLFGILFITILSAKVPRAEAETNPCITTPTSGPMSSGPVRVPMAGSYVATSPFGMRVNPGGVLRGRYMLHAGIDLVSKSRMVVAAMGGTVKSTPVNSISGYQVIVDVGGGVLMWYAHMVPGSIKVKAGDPVWPGRHLGTEGATGNVTGVHLHFTITINGKPIDPAPWMAAKGAPFPVIKGRSVGPAVAANPPSSGSSRASSDPSTSSLPTIEPIPVSGRPDPAMPFTLPAADKDKRRASKLNPPLSIPPDFQAAYQAAAKRFGIPWTLLAGIGMEETGHGRNPNVSSAGAQGPMQWLPKYWGAYAIDGNNDGKKDIHDIWDAAHTSANVLVKNGVKTGPEGVKKAIWMYNHADWYVADVLYYAGKYGGGEITADGGSGCDTTGSAAQTKGPLPPAAEAGKGSAAQIVQAARAWIGTPYSWGGGNVSGPTRGIKSQGLDGTGTVGFDCSGLVMHAVHRGMGVTLSHSAEAQAFWSGNDKVTATKIPRDFTQMRPGDLIGFSKKGGAPGTFGHIGIYIGDHKMIDAPKPGIPVRVFDLDTKGVYDVQTWQVVRLTPKAS